jgi:cysteine-rich repeat protein
VSTTIPSALFPGERRFFQVTMQNTGAASPANDWLATGNPYALYGDQNFRVAYNYVPTLIPVGSSSTFTFIATAPTFSTSFTARMYAGSLGPFGATVSVPVDVNTGVKPNWGCTFLPGSSSIPTNLAPGEARWIAVAVQNTGSQTWPANDVVMASRDNPVNFWNQTVTGGTSAVIPDGTASFSFQITAPTTPGVYSFLREMRHTTGIGDFRLSQQCVETTITVGGTPPLNAALVSHTFPTTMAANEARGVSVVMQNTGTETWAADGTYVLYSQNAPTNLWGATVAAVGTATIQGDNASLFLTITAPPAAGSYAHKWRMRKTAGGNAGFFGPLIDLPVTVSASAPPLGAAVVSQTLPSRMTAGGSYNFQITMQNTGGQAWTGTPFKLYSQNAPGGLWGNLQSVLGASETISPGASRVFNIPILAPATPGTYTSAWRMFQSPGVGPFGALAQTTGLVVTLCGNNVIDAGERCDDGNLINGDECSDTCQFEQIVIDPGVTPSGRTIYGTGSGAQVGPVAIGDVTGDGILDVLTSQTTPAPGTGNGKGQAGSVWGFTSSPFLNGTSNIVTTANFVIGGAERNDFTGSSSGGRFVIGQITGSATADVIVSSRFAAGPSNSRTAAGEIYVITGGAIPALVDLGLSPLPSVVGAHITGIAGDALQALAVASLVGGDSVPDLLIGAPGRAGARGALIMIPGPISGEIDLASPPAGTVTILGGAGEQLGLRAAVGDLNNDAVNDILAGCSTSSVSGRNLAGAAYSAFGPFTSALDFSLPAGVPGGPAGVWWGQSPNDNLGANVAIGNVTGSATNEALIGATQMRKNPANALDQYGAVTVWSSASGFKDLASTPATVAVFGVDLNDECGNTVGAAKVSGGSYDDIIMGCGTSEGAPNNIDRAGEIHVIRGRTTFPAVWDIATSGSNLVIYGSSWGGFLGRGLNTLGLADFNADGRVDICGGSYNGQFGSSVVVGRLDCYSSPL